MTDRADRGPNGVFQADTGYGPVRPRLSASDFTLQLWRAKWRMVLVALPIFLIGLFLAWQMPITFESRSALYIASGGQVQAASNRQGPGSNQGLSVQEAVQGEIEILKTHLVAERALSRFPLSRIYPRLARAQKSALDRADAGQSESIENRYFQNGVEALRKSIRVSAAPNSNIIEVSIKHKDPGIAAELLNALLATYLNRRTELFAGQPGDQPSVERKQVEAALLNTEDEIRVFLDTHSIRDFGSERATAQGLHSVISNELSVVQGRKRAVAAQLSRTRSQAEETPKEQDLFVEDSSAQRLRELERERTQALVNYTPDSRRVQAIEAQIADLRAAIASTDGPTGTVPRTPNPTYQALETAMNALEAEAGALNQQSAELNRQLQAVEEKLNRFTGLDAEWNELQRNRDLIEANLRTLATQIQGAGGGGGMSRVDSVKITESATVPLTGKSLKVAVAILATLLAAFAALISGLSRALSQRGFSTPGALRRTTGMPVLAAIGRV